MPEQVPEGSQPVDSFLNPRTTRVIQSDYRHAGLDRQVHHPGQLLPMYLGEGTAQHREVLGKQRHTPALDLSEAGDHPITRVSLRVHAEVVVAMCDKRPDLVKASRIKQAIDAFAGGQLALCMLGLDALLTPALRRLLTLLQKMVDHRLVSVR